MNESQILQKTYGRWIVAISTIAFFPCAIILLGIACNSEKTDELVDFISSGKVETFGKREVMLARLMLALIFAALGTFIVLAVTVGQNW